MLSYLADFEEFCAEHLVQSVGRWANRPFELEPFQREIFGEALAVDEDGQQLWDQVAIIVPRKNGKTTMLSAYAVWCLVMREDSPEILLAATSDKQADRLFRACSAFIRKSSVLSDMCRVRDHAGEIVREDGMGIVYRMSSDPARLHGYNPSLVIADEVGEWVTPNLRRAYEALTTADAARIPQVFIITTAGAARDRQEGILGRILDGALARGEVERYPGKVICRVPESRSLVWSYEAPTADRFDVAAFKLANPASWVTEGFLLKKAHSDLTDSAFFRYHGCVWAEAATAWLPNGAWAACAHEDGLEWPDAGEEVILGFDGSYGNDSTALVGCTIGERPHLFVVAVWERPEQAADWVVPRNEVMVEVDKALARWQVPELVCDPPGWHREIEEWGEMYGNVITLMFPTNRRQLMSEACSRFYTAVVNGELTHDNHPDLARHLSNAVVKEFVEPGGHGAYITKEHRSSTRKIDLAVAAVTAFARASVAPPSVYVV